MKKKRFRKVWELLDNFLKMFLHQERIVTKNETDAERPAPNELQQTNYV